jgi:U6 snRNA-associated Sm-like protein LSm4
MLCKDYFCYIRGSTIKYLRIPDEVIDMVKEEVIQKSKGRGEGRGRGGPQRGRGGRGKFVGDFNMGNIICAYIS